MSQRDKTPLMPKATALWLIEETSLTFEQIAEFCGLHILEVQGIADGEVARGMRPCDPTASRELTWEEIERCSKDSKQKLQLKRRVSSLDKNIEKKKKASKYTPMARRQDKPKAIAWLLKNCPEMTDLQIVKLIGTTKTTIISIREGTHWNSENIIPKDPVLLGVCSQGELNIAHEKALKKAQSQKKIDTETGEEVENMKENQG